MDTKNESKEQRILRLVKRVLTDVARDTHVTPGQQHPLSENTIMGIRDCLGLIASREREIAEAAGAPSRMRPRFIDEPKTTHTIKVADIKKKGD